MQLLPCCLISVGNCYEKIHVETRATIFDKCSQIMAHIDNVVIMGRRLHDVKEVFTSLVKQTNKMGSDINK